MAFAFFTAVLKRFSRATQDRTRFLPTKNNNFVDRIKYELITFDKIVIGFESRFAGYWFSGFMQEIVGQKAANNLFCAKIYFSAHRLFYNYICHVIIVIIVRLFLRFKILQKFMA